MREVKEVKTIYVTKYEASDGCRFDTEQECIDHEATLGTKRSLVKSIECTNCWIPFSGWDMDPDASKLYLIKSREEYEALNEHYSTEYDSYNEGWDASDEYPVVFLVLAREGYSIGYRLSEDCVDLFHKTADVINEYLCKKEQLKNN